MLFGQPISSECNKPFDARLQIDYRIGGISRYYLGEPELMLIPDEVRKCVGFAFYQTQNGYGVGTVFFVGYQTEPNSLGLVYTYAITAKHVYEGAAKESLDGKIILRLNFKDGSAKLVETKVAQWLTHPIDDSVDVAVLPFGFPKDIDHLYFPTQGFATKEVIEQQSIGLGDDLFMVGLFTGHLETKKNIPIVRIGNIAAMPEEPVDTKMYGKIEAYLVEARSIGGLSGSPVFVNVGGTRTIPSKGTIVSPSMFYLLGLMHGHWDRQPAERSDLGIVEPRDESVNMGIAIVIPATKILEVLNQPRLAEARQAIEKTKRTERLPTADS